MTPFRCDVSLSNSDGTVCENTPYVRNYSNKNVAVLDTAQHRVGSLVFWQAFLGSSWTSRAEWFTCHFDE